MREQEMQVQLNEGKKNNLIKARSRNEGNPYWSYFEFMEGTETSYSLLHIQLLATSPMSGAVGIDIDNLKSDEFLSGQEAWEKWQEVITDPELKPENTRSPQII
jgi:hypothetical protein